MFLSTDCNFVHFLRNQQMVSSFISEETYSSFVDCFVTLKGYFAFSVLNEREKLRVVGSEAKDSDQPVLPIYDYSSDKNTLDRPHFDCLFNQVPCQFFFHSANGASTP